MATLRSHNEATKNLMENRPSVLLAGDQMDELREKFVKVCSFFRFIKRLTKYLRHILTLIPSDLESRPGLFQYLDHDPYAEFKTR